MNKGIKYKWNSFFGRIIFMVTLGIGLIAVIVSVVVLSMSQNAFRETYGKSQEQVFNQIEKELNDLHTDLQDIVNAIDSSWAFRLYLSDEGRLDNVQNFQNIYQMEKDLEQSKAAGMERLNILVLSMHGKHYLSRTETISMSDEEILASEAVRKALKSRKRCIIYIPKEPILQPPKTVRSCLFPRHYITERAWSPMRWCFLH